jgi:hypothetical protein
MAPQTVAGRPNPRPKGVAGLGATATKADSVGRAGTTSAPSYSTCCKRRSGTCMTTRPLRRRSPIRYRKIHERGCLVRSRSRLGSHSLLGSFLTHAVLWIGRSVPTQRCDGATNPPLLCKRRRCCRSVLGSSSATPRKDYEPSAHLCAAGRRPSRRARPKLAMTDSNNAP